MNGILDTLFGKKEEKSILEQEIQSDIENQVSNFETGENTEIENPTVEDVINEVEVESEAEENIESVENEVVEVADDKASAEGLSPYDALSQIKILIDQIPSSDFNIVNLRQQIYSLIERVV